MKKLFLLLFLLVPFKVFAFSSNAVSTVLIDMDSKRILYADNAHHVQSVASISKIMTAVVALENTDIKKRIVVGDEVLKAYGSGIYIKQGEMLTICDLLYGLMLRSGNDAAISIAVNTSSSVSKFVDKMNDKAKSLSMDDTVFNNPSGLDEEKGNFSSAYDMALLMSYAMGNEEFRKIVGTKVYTLKTNKNVYKWRNKNKLLFSYKYTTGGKTGFTKKAKRTLVTSASKDGLNLAVVTINDGSDWKDHQSLYDEAFSKYTNYLILSKGNLSIPLEDYYNDDKLYIKNNVLYPLLESEKDSVRVKYELLKERDYKSGDKVGYVRVYLADKLVKSEKIYVKRVNNKRLSWFK